MAKKDSKYKSAEAQEKLRAFLSRRHPEYEGSIAHWEFLEHCYEGGREWFKSNVFRYIKEGDTEYADRVNRAYRFNHTREVVDLVDKYLFKMQVARQADAPDYIQKFWKNATLNKVSIKDYMKQVSKMTSIYGRIWIVVDSNLTEAVVSKADEKKQDIRAYTYFVTPENAVDMSWDDYGNLNWILIHEETRDDNNPIDSSGDTVHKFRLWEREQWTLFTLTHNGKSQSAKLSSAELAAAVTSLGNSTAAKIEKVVQKDNIDSYDVSVDGPFPHSFGEVPVFHADNVISNELYKSTALIDDVAYLDRAVANYLSNLDAIIQDQTFSQLIMPAQGLSPGDDAYNKMVEMGTKRIFTYDGDSGNKPEYISPDVRQAEIILKVISKIINEIYHTVGLAGERTKEDNSLGIDNSSGVAKAYDFERVNSLLASKADSLELTENKIIEFVRRWNGEVKEIDNYVLYPENFDVRGLYDEFEIATTLGSISAPDGVRRLQMEAVIDKLFPRLAKDLKEKISAELKAWPPKVEVDAEGNEVKPAEGAKSASSTKEVGDTVKNPAK
jgi:hypothetical protein